MQQTWRDLTFLHWRYNPEIIRSTLPPQLTLDTFDGSAWIGLVPFLLENVRVFGLPAIPWLSTFPETNVRTYVLGPDGKPGVWFYTLEADRLPAVLAARSWYKLAYRWADMRISSENQTVEYKSTRSSLFGKGSTDIAVEVGDEMPTGDLDHFLTARFRLYAAHRSRIAYANIQHPTWPLRHARITRLEEDLIFHSGVPAPVGEPLVHFSRELHVTAQTLRWF